MLFSWVDDGSARVIVPSSQEIKGLVSFDDLIKEQNQKIYLKAIDIINNLLMFLYPHYKIFF